ncbi:hypothetical protein GA707_19445 [Nostocoides sp. F2B08]|uniref:hypothetical protein n=1 Tax=Nostocoides sp. F2B08 TaxID=2653936 RepID=UPI0012639204|nr:hypothetical protein [Tetrasphaera sp. F2B08]KAB7740334.1 hypothetical protein GA707_19445 [Tetrasphaera sp. F2B08]
MADAEERKQRLEEQKVALDYLKHVSTLATSVIVLSIAFTSQLSNRDWSWLLIPGIGGQFICLLALTLAAIGTISAGRSVEPPTPSVVRFTVIGSLAGLAAFLISIAAFSTFLLKNLV